MFNSLRAQWNEAIAIAGLKNDLLKYIARGELNKLLSEFDVITRNIECPHNASHLLFFMRALLELDSSVPGDIVEAGCFRGGSTAKISLIAERLDRNMQIYDSFQGLPKNAEDHQKSILGHSIDNWFVEGEFHGSLREVQESIETYGRPERCTLVPGWFEQSLPPLTDPICAAYIDVDLASSTRTCLKYLYPRISSGGVLVSQDGDFPLVIEVFKDQQFWEEEVGCDMPVVEGIGVEKMLIIHKH